MGISGVCLDLCEGSGSHDCTTSPRKPLMLPYQCLQMVLAFVLKEKEMYVFDE